MEHRPVVPMHQDCGQRGGSCRLSDFYPSACRRRYRHPFCSPNPWRFLASLFCGCDKAIIAHVRGIRAENLIRMRTAKNYVPSSLPPYRLDPPWRSFASPFDSFSILRPKKPTDNGINDKIDSDLAFLLSSINVTRYPRCFPPRFRRKAVRFFIRYLLERGVRPSIGYIFFLIYW